MAIVLAFKNLEQTPPTVQIGPTINSVPSTALTYNIVASGPNAGALVMTNVGPSNAGGLLTWKLPSPVLGSTVLPYLKFEFDGFIDDINSQQLSRFENDIKVVLQAPPNSASPISNTYNFSSQFNGSEGGMFQIDNSNREWADTGFKPGMPVADIWTHYSFWHFMDVPNSKFSFQQVGVGSTIFSIPAVMQELPLQSSNWAAVMVVQLQTEIAQYGACQTLYKNIAVTCSDQPLE